MPEGSDGAGLDSALNRIGVGMAAADAAAESWLSRHGGAALFRRFAAVSPLRVVPALLGAARTDRTTDSGRLEAATAGFAVLGAFFSAPAVAGAAGAAGAATTGLAAARVGLEVLDGRAAGGCEHSAAVATAMRAAGGYLGDGIDSAGAAGRVYASRFAADNSGRLQAFSDALANDPHG